MQSLMTPSILAVREYTLSLFPSVIRTPVFHVLGNLRQTAISISQPRPTITRNTREALPPQLSGCPLMPKWVGILFGISAQKIIRIIMQAAQTADARAVTAFSKGVFKGRFQRAFWEHSFRCGSCPLSGPLCRPGISLKPRAPKRCRLSADSARQWRAVCGWWQGPSRLMYGQTRSCPFPRA